VAHLDALVLKQLGGALHQVQKPASIAHVLHRPTHLLGDALVRVLLPEHRVVAVRLLESREVAAHQVLDQLDLKDLLVAE